MSLGYLFTIKEGKPIVLRREGVTEIPSFDEDWELANASLAPTDYHADMTGVRKAYRADMAVHRKSSLTIDTSPSRTPNNPLPITPPSSNGSEIEVFGNPTLTPTASFAVARKRTAEHEPVNGQAKKRTRYVPPHWSPHIDNLSPPRPTMAHPHWSPPIDSPSPPWPSMTCPVSPIPSLPPQFPSISPYHASPASFNGRQSPTASYSNSSASASPSPSVRRSHSPDSPPSRPTKQSPWHNGLYCVEFANGLDEINRSVLSQEDAFYDAFPGRRWVRRTFQDNKRQWLDLASPSDCANAIKAGRTKQGLWRRFSRAHPIAKKT